MEEQPSLAYRIVQGMFAAFSAVIIATFSLVGAIFGRAVMEIIGIILLFALILIAGGGS